MRFGGLALMTFAFACAKTSKAPSQQALPAARQVTPSGTELDLGAPNVGPGTSLLWGYYIGQFGQCFSWFGDDDGPDASVYRPTVKEPSDVANFYSECINLEGRPASPCTWRWPSAPSSTSCPAFYFQTANLPEATRLASRENDPRGFLFATEKIGAEGSEIQLYNSGQPISVDSSTSCGTASDIPQQELSLTFLGLPAGNQILGKKSSSRSKTLDYPYMIKEMKSLLLDYSVQGSVLPSSCPPELNRISIFKPTLLFDLYPAGTNLGAKVNQSLRIAQYAIVIDHFLDPPLKKTKYQAFPEIALFNDCENASFPGKKNCTIHVKLDELINLKLVTAGQKDSLGFVSYRLDAIALLKRYHNDLPREFTNADGKKVTIPQFFPSIPDQVETNADGTTTLSPGNDFGSSVIRALQFIGTQTGGVAAAKLRHLNLRMAQCMDENGVQAVCPEQFFP